MSCFARGTHFSFVSIISALTVAVSILGFAQAARSQAPYDVLHAFRNIGVGPNQLVRTTDGNFYGTTQQGGQFGYGTVFKIASNGSFSLLRSFNYSDGANPNTSLIQDSDGNFYGTTQVGGQYGRGTVFKIASDDGTVSLLHSFNGSDGYYPQASLMQGSDGNFYGTTQYGGQYGRGTVFKIASNGSVSRLHSFNDSDGAYPYASLMQGSDGNLYGTTQQGGQFGYGTVFTITLDGHFFPLHSFNGSDGNYPQASLVQGSDGNFYGTTQNGGQYGSGTVFKIASDDGTVSLLRSFNYSDGANPYASLVQGSDGNFYGTTQNGGQYGYGTVFTIASDDGTVSLLRSFNYSDGANPQASLVQGSDGNFYGTTQGGGQYGRGTVFTIASDDGTVSLLHSFNYSDGANPQASLIQGSDSNFYGTTQYGGQYGRGTVFKIASNGSVCRLHSFNYSDGAYPQTSLTQGDDDNFYGTATQGGPDGGGVVFRLPLDNQPPAITITSPANDAVLSLNEVVRSNYSCTDASGVNNCAGAVPNGSNINTSSAGTKSFTVTATDGACNTATLTHTYTVKKGVPGITWNKPADVTYGTPLSGMQLNAIASVAGTYTYTPPLGTVLNSGDNQLLSVLFTPNNIANYDTATKTVSINVKQGTPVITWNSPAGITYGTPLSGTQLNATASVPGTFVYTPAAGTVLNAGAGQLLSVTFTPTDQANYTTATKAAHINVLKATSTLTWSPPADIPYGTALSGTQLNATASVPGTFVYTPAAGTVLNAGAGQLLSVTFTPTDQANYTTATKAAHINVLKATSTLTWSPPADIPYGTALSGTQLNATASVPGTFVYTPAAGTVLNAGAGQLLSVTFTPTDTTNYNTVSKDVTILVTSVITVTSPAKLWIGLKNSDDQGTNFDVRTEVYKNDTLVASGETHCVTGVTRNPDKAKEVSVSLGAITNGSVVSGDELSLKMLIRIGTNEDGTKKCPGHSNAVGLRLYYDAVSRPARFGVAIAPDVLKDFFLHGGSVGVFNATAPTGTSARYMDSAGINFRNGNPWEEIGTWSMTLR